MKLLAAILLAVFAPLAFATNLTVQCVPSTKNTDGSAFATGATPQFNLYGNYQGQPLVLLTPTPSANCLFVRQNVNPGTIEYAVTQVETLNGVVGPESAQTAPIATTVPAAPPAPGGVTVSLATTSTIAYMFVPGNDIGGVAIVGTVPLGTPCDPTQPILKYFVIPHAAVTLTGPINQLKFTLGSCT